MRRRYQATVNTTLDSLYTASRHLLQQQPMLLTVDASNYEAMQALVASLQSIRSIGTVVTRVVDAADTLVGGDASATLEIVNVTVDKAASTMSLTVDFRFPLADYFYLYMHLGSLPPPCPPFDPTNRCCHGDMSNTEFVTAGAGYVDCTSNDPFGALDHFVGMWNGVYLSDDKQIIQFTIFLPSIPSTIETTAQVYRLGIGMVVFGRLAQNTEARVEMALGSSSVATSFGAFQYSCVEYTRLQLESCAGAVFAHLIIKASGVQSVQNLHFQTWDAGEWIAPNCTNGTVMLGMTPLRGCNVSIDADFVNIYVSMAGINRNLTTALYVLLQSGSVLTRVVTKTDNTTIEHCTVPVTINPMSHNAFTIQVKQGNRMLYNGPVQLVQLVDVAALTLTIVSSSALYSYAFDNISVVYSLVDSSRILALMPDGEVTPALERLCDSGNVCLIEELLVRGVCQTGEKCETQGDSLFLMPLYPWGGATLKSGTYTVMVADIKETLLPNNGPKNSSSIVRRLLGWIFE